jgi:uncharacterized membrane protein YqhA
LNAFINSRYNAADPRLVKATRLKSNWLISAVALTMLVSLIIFCLEVLKNLYRDKNNIEQRI